PTTQSRCRLRRLDRRPAHPRTEDSLWMRRLPPHSSGSFRMWATTRRLGSGPPDECVKDALGGVTKVARLATCPPDDVVAHPWQFPTVVGRYRSGSHDSTSTEGGEIHR